MFYRFILCNKFLSSNCIKLKFAPDYLIYFFILFLMVKSNWMTFSPFSLLRWENPGKFDGKKKLFKKKCAIAFDIEMADHHQFDLVKSIFTSDIWNLNKYLNNFFFFWLRNTSKQVARDFYTKFSEMNDFICFFVFFFLNWFCIWFL